MDWPLLSALSEEERRRVLVMARRRRFARHEVIFHDGDPGDTLHLIARGHVAIRVTTPLGDVATLRILKHGEFFGELALVAPAPRRGTAIAIGTAETLSLHREQFAELRTQHPSIDRILIDALANEVRRLASQLVDALYVPVEQRVWRRLEELADAFHIEGETTVQIPLKQEEIAQIVGTTRPTINRLLRAAEEAGMVRVTRGQL
ncbi:MAG: Crp/Fnr family transcriptional regulator, partial [Actinobacteria bacterium]